MIFQIFDHELDIDALPPPGLPSIALFAEAWRARGLDRAALDEILVGNHIEVAGTCDSP